MSTGGSSRDSLAWREAVRDAERQGELLTAFDAAERGLIEHPGDRWLQHRAVLALARAGSTKEAQRRFREYGLGDVETEDAKALEARLEKDLGLATTGESRRVCAARAAALYHAVFESTGGYYSGINAATMHLLAGEAQKAHALAERVLALSRMDNDDSYYAAATEAEARLLLGDVEAARDALDRAAERAEGDQAAIATTRRQLRIVCAALGVDESMIEALPVPEVVHYCGHMFGAAGRFRATDEPNVTERIQAAIEARPIGYGYGSLASGADILWAEALLERGAELHVVLPFAQEEFVEISVAPAGSTWVQRFHRCLDRVVGVHYATEDAYLGDDVLFGYASELAMGLAILRARHLDAAVSQVALWDGRPAQAAAGTAIDVETWRRRGLPSVIVPVEVPGSFDEGRPATDGTVSHRVVRALLFADVKGFSRLRDEQLPRFFEHVLGAFADVLRVHEGAICYCNTWGDALYVVVTDAEAAASLALDLQAAIASLDPVVTGLPPLALRISAHLGPVYPINDPILGTSSFAGSHVSRTARIEPVTPEGSIYVTERFAAALLLTTSDAFACDYVGHMPAAKEYGRMRMYRLRLTRETSRQAV